ncbi:hypothetical protein HDU76_009326 [Blyttiomyces sp. JEL0837]|nr:hypothetical protein HDU76_009326 [Blyttiomyces sp. JEL0837]
MVVALIRQKPHLSDASVHPARVIYEFFLFYGLEFDYNRYMLCPNDMEAPVCPRKTTVPFSVWHCMPRTDYFLYNSDRTISLAIQDPVDEMNNLSKGSYRMTEIRDAFNDSLNELRNALSDPNDPHPLRNQSRRPSPPAIPLALPAPPMPSALQQQLQLPQQHHQPPLPPSQRSFTFPFPAQQQHQRQLETQQQESPLQPQLHQSRSVSPPAFPILVPNDLQISNNHGLLKRARSQLEANDVHLGNSAAMTTNLPLTTNTPTMATPAPSPVGPMPVPLPIPMHIPLPSMSISRSVAVPLPPVMSPYMMGFEPFQNGGRGMQVSASGDARMGKRLVGEI